MMARLAEERALATAAAESGLETEAGVKPDTKVTFARNDRSPSSSGGESNDGDSEDVREDGEEEEETVGGIEATVGTSGVVSVSVLASADDVETSPA